MASSTQPPCERRIPQASPENQVCHRQCSNDLFPAGVCGTSTTHALHIHHHDTDAHAEKSVLWHFRLLSSGKRTWLAQSREIALTESENPKEKSRVNRVAG